jgi:hypothetical protein
MVQENDRKELERRLEQARRMAAAGFDPVTKERLERLVEDLDEQLCFGSDTSRSRIRRDTRR